MKLKASPQSLPQGGGTNTLIYCALLPIPTWGKNASPQPLPPGGRGFILCKYSPFPPGGRGPDSYREGGRGQ
jgi:hypothetical protein